MPQELYNKYRSMEFSDVIGQDHITQTLQAEVENGKISHTYLFTGSRGTGKTTCARILSKAINCLHTVNGNPCNKCDICQGINNNSITDVVEIDAASNNGVDDVRDIIEKLNYPPAYTKYRVYIIDEVHKLSSSAFDALLKSLEEPPSHVIFILATTEVHKIPVTILSRCQRFNFKRITTKDIISRLKYVAQNENVTITDEAAYLMANIADGGMRDALTYMGQSIVISSEITEKIVSEAIALAGNKNLFDFSDYIVNEDFTNSLLLINKLHNESCDISRICFSLISHFRNLMVAKTVNDCHDLINCSEDELKKYKSNAEKFTITKILECIEILSKTSELIKNSENKKIHLESALIKMCGVKNTDKGTQFYPSAEERIIALEEKIDSLIENGIEINSDTKKKISKNKEEKKTHVVEVVKEKQPLKDGAFGLWPEVIQTVLKYDPAIYGMISNTNAIIRDNKIVIVTDNSFFKDYLMEDERYKIVYKAIEEVTGERIKVSIKCTANEPIVPNFSPLDNIINKTNEFNKNN